MRRTNRVFELNYRMSFMNPQRRRREARRFFLPSGSVAIRAPYRQPSEDEHRHVARSGVRRVSTGVKCSSCIEQFGTSRATYDTKNKTRSPQKTKHEARATRRSIPPRPWFQLAVELLAVSGMDALSSCSPELGGDVTQPPHSGRKRSREKK